MQIIIHILVEIFLAVCIDVVFACETIFFVRLFTLQLLLLLLNLLDRLRKHNEKCSLTYL